MNLIAGGLTAIAVAATAFSSAPTAISIFGVWAIISGVIQTAVVLLSAAPSMPLVRGSRKLSTRSRRQRSIASELVGVLLGGNAGADRGDQVDNPNP